MDKEPTSDDKATRRLIEGYKSLTTLAWGAIVAPIAIGLALGVVVVTGEKLCSLGSTSRQLRTSSWLSCSSVRPYLSRITAR